jgi:hypothetical protein
MPLIIADSQYIETHILASVVIVNQHPTLQNLKASLTSIDAECGTCSGRQSEAERRKREVWNDIRVYLAMLPDSQKSELRQQLNLRPGDRLRVSFTTGVAADSQIDAREI